MNYTELEPHKRIHPGFTVGLAGGLVMMLISLAVFFMNGAETNGDLLVWFLQLVAYFFLGRIAAGQQAESQQHTYEPTRGIVGAAVGAALVTSIMMWIFIIVRGLVRDALGYFIVIEPFTFCGWIILDVSLALGIGGFAGRSVEKQYHADPYDTSNF
jgi:hypothetical protein